MVLEVRWDGLGNFSFGLSQFHGHGSWLVCEEWPVVQGKYEHGKNGGRRDEKNRVDRQASDVSV